MAPPSARTVTCLSPQKINRISIWLLVIGLGLGLAIFFTAQPVTFDPLIGDPLTSKRHLHEMRMIGGKGNVIAAEFTAWFASLWRGPTLGGTVAVLSVLLTLSFRFVAARPEIFAPFEPEEKSPPVSRT